MDISYLQGPIETLYRTSRKFFFFLLFNSFHLDVIDKQALNIVPYAKYLMLPCIQCMTHQDWYIRSIASNCFAVLIKYYALYVRFIGEEKKCFIMIKYLE
jgi:hypothetical protein